MLFDEVMTGFRLGKGGVQERYGVTPDMFPIMGQSMLLMLEKILGDNFNDVTREAWKETYAELSQDMIRAQTK